MAYSYSYSRL